MWRTEGGWKGELSEGLVDRSHLPSLPAELYVNHCYRAACILWIYLCVSDTWEDEGDLSREAGGCSVPPVRVDDLCSSVSSSAAATSTHTLH